MVRPDPLGRAMLDYARGDYETGACEYVDGERRARAHVRENYFDGPDLAGDGQPRLRTLADAGGPVLDVGCGAGQDALWLQERVDTWAVDASPGAVRAAREMGVEQVTEMDLFDLAVPSNAVRSVHCVGTQAMLARSTVALAGVLSEFARITDDDGVAFVDAQDPDHEDADSLFGYRDDPRRGFGHRAFHFEYGAETGRTLGFTLYSPDRFRDAVAATEWHVADVTRWRESPHYVVELQKEGRWDND